MLQAKKSNDSVDDWMTKNVARLPPSSNIYSVVELMNKRKAGSILIGEQSRSIFSKAKGLQGIITDTDIVQKVVAQNLSPKNATAEKIMTKDPFCLESNSNLIQASQIMASRRIKRLPIMKESSIIGIITTTNLMHALVQLGKIYEVGELVKYIAKKKVGSKQFEHVVHAKKWMNINVVTCSQSTSMQEIAKRMTEYKIGSVMVMGTDEKVEGIVTDTDIVRQLHQEDVNTSLVTAQQLMKPDVISIGPEDSLIVAADLMSKKNIKRIPILDNGKLEGILTVTDVVDALLQLNSFAQAHKIIEILYED